jgi:hypothetical protein
MKKYVYLVQHIYEDETHEDTKLVGVFSSRAKANMAVEESKGLSGFNSYPYGFEISKCEIDRREWLEGFAGPDVIWPPKE